MSLFSRFAALFRKNAPVAAPDEPEPAKIEESLAAKAAHAVSEQHYDEALAMLHGARGGAEEAAVVEAIGFSLPEAAPREADALVLALADVLVARGERKRACNQLERTRTPAARVLRADLLCEGDATDEDLDLALSLYAEALREDLDAPGARERWERLRQRLGRSGGATQPSMGATLLSPGGSLPYTLVREVARGGSAVVYEATAQLLQGKSRTIALKLAHERKTARSWLAHEARVAIRFRGPGVIPIFDVDPEEGWLAMAWAEGGSLREKLRAPETDPRFVRALLATLADVHAAGFIHGDLKPANVLFDAEGNPWLGDFALARPIGEPATPGSAGYVSPERMAGAPCDPRDDVFAVGKILNELHAHAAAARACLLPAGQRPATASDVIALL
ncbi:MAG: serine/threonine-protein kinase [Polyangiales bacterium]